MKQLSRRELGAKFSEGSRLLWVAIRARGWTQQRAMRELGLATGQVARLLFGDRRPARQTAEQLRRALGIEPGTWDEDPSEAFELPELVQAAPDAARTRGPLPRSITDKKKTKVRQVRDRTRPANATQEAPASSRRPGAKKRTPAKARRAPARKAA